MAKGRQNKESGYCDYQFTDGTYCKETIELTILQENGKPITMSGWGDKEKRNYCLFHSHNDDDKVGFFYPEIKKRIKNSNDPVKKRLTELDGKQLSDEEKEKQEIKIRNEYFLDFEGFYFPKIADFEKTVFEASVIFYEAEFGGEASFSEATFGFGGEANFEWAKFGSEADFSEAMFGGVARFYAATFGGVASFWCATFGDGANFHYANFGGEASFWDAKFGGEVSFSEATFDGEADFKWAEFGGEANFEEVRFGGKAFFPNATFCGVASFWSATFGGEANFEEVRFGGVANFGWAKFSREASFDRSLFDKSTDFSHTAFLKTLDFTDAAFLAGTLDFTRARFPAEETFFHKTVFNCEVLFHEQMLKGVRFTGCYLGSASFYGSDVRDAVFINSSWNRGFLKKQIQKLITKKRIEKNTPVLEISKILESRKRRAVLWDEYIYHYQDFKSTGTLEKIKIWLFFGLKSSRSGIKSFLKKIWKKEEAIPPASYNIDPSRLELDPLYLEHLYCQLKLAMDRNKMYSLANDFYHGEKLMETKRLWEERSFLKWAFLWLYRLLAGFGNSPWRAIISLVLILFASSFLLIKFDGLKVLKPDEALERCPCTTNIKVAPARPDTRQAAALAKFGKSFITVDMAELALSLNALDKFSKGSNSSVAQGAGLQEKQAGYSLKCNYLCNVFYVSLWNLTATPGGRSDYYREKGPAAYLAVFFIQYIFRPLMIALIIISVRRKVYRG